MWCSHCAKNKKGKQKNGHRRNQANPINDNSNIIEDLGADSIDLVELLMTIEEKKGIVVSDEDAVKLKTVKDVADYIEQHS